MRHEIRFTPSMECLERWSVCFPHWLGERHVGEQAAEVFVEESDFAELQPQRTHRGCNARGLGNQFRARPTAAAQQRHVRREIRPAVFGTQPPDDCGQAIEYLASWNEPQGIFVSGRHREESVKIKAQTGNR